MALTKKGQELLKKYRENPIEFFVEIYGIKLFPWQKIYLKFILKYYENKTIK